MYNRYIRSDDGAYERVPVQEAPPRETVPPPPERAAQSEGGRGFLNGVLKKLGLEDLDTGDLLLLVLLFLLFREGEDEELLIALGLLLIL